MSQAPAGWYPDPSGIPNTFRWWDGAAWTTALSASAGAPPPLNAPTAHPGDRHGGDQGQARTDADRPGPDSASASATADSATSRAVPDHPGPDYEPAAWRHLAGAGAGTPGDGGAPPAMDGTGGISTKAVVGIFAGVFVVAVLAGALYLYLDRKGDDPIAGPTSGPTASVTTPPTQPTPSSQPPATPTARPTQGPTGQPTSPPTQQPTQQPTPPQTPPQTPQQSPQSPQPPDQPYTQAHLVFQAPGSPWEEQRLTSLLGATVYQWQGFSKTTESDYDGSGGDWTAVMVSGTPSSDFGIQDNPEKGLRAFSAWYERTFFAGSEVTVTERSSKKITVDGRDAWQLVLDYHYSVPGLRATGERVTLVGMRTPTDGPALFVASIPNTDTDLNADVRAAVKSLTIEQ